MAGRKLTQLPILTTPAPNDKVYIVDVSDTSESPQGTSKEIEVQNLGANSGTWTPTISGEVGISPVVIREGWYIKVGNIVKATCGFSIEFDVTEQEQGFSFTLPIEPNNDFTTQFEIQGVAYNGTSIITTDKIEVYANASSKEGYFIVTLTALGLSCNCVIDITYSIDN
jgi:hypothetical protein